MGAKMLPPFPDRRFPALISHFLPQQQLPYAWPEMDVRGPLCLHGMFIIHTRRLLAASKETGA
jgi:hypothetical protein